MNKLVVIAVMAASLGIAFPVQAAKQWDDLSWWGNTGAKPDVVEDSSARAGNCTACPIQNVDVGRRGCWWWPKKPASNDNDHELWGNRGIVFHRCEVNVEVPVSPPFPPDFGPRETPVFVFNNVLFDLNKAVLRSEGKAAADVVINEMKKYLQDTLEIEGHACDLGTDAYNLSLGQKRADAVKAYMVESGIAPSRIQTKSLGATAPTMPNTSEEYRKLNRRAAFKLTIHEEGENLEHNTGAEDPKVPRP